MRQKFILENNATRNEFNIKEYAFLDREQKSNPLEPKHDAFTLLCEETYERELILSAVGKGRKSMVSAIRTGNMYPILLCAEKIADAIIELCRTENHLPVELLFDDKNTFDSDESSDAKP